MAVSFNRAKNNLLNSAAAAVLALPLWAGASLAQEAQAQTEGTEQSQQTDQSQQAQQSGDAGQATGGQQAQGQGDASDALIATVGDAEIRSSDLMRAIGALPPQLSSQPPEMVMSMALQQLVLREAIVQEARSQGLAEDSEVQSLVQGATQTAEEDALVQVWLQRELANRVTPEAVDQAYAGLQAVATDEVPPLEQLRPQIEQNLAQQAVNDIRGSLLSDMEITVYGPDGQPMDEQQGGGQGADSGQDNAGGNGGQSGDANGGQDQSQGNAAGEDGSGGEQDSAGEQSSDN